MNLKPFNEEVPKTEVEVTKQFLQLPENRQKIILTAALEYETMNQQEKLIEAQRNKMVRPIVEGAADAYGIEDSDGHMHLVMEEDGVSAEIVRTRKISRTLNSVAAEELLKRKDLYDSCVMQVVSWEIDEEKIIEAYNAGLIAAEELDSIFSEKISWATSIKTDSPQIEAIKKIRKEVEKAKPQGELPTVESDG
jgi:hypothetical protein